VFKSCPRCNAEFLPHVSECPDCRVALQHGDAAEFTAIGLRERKREAEPTEARGMQDPVLLRGGEVAELRQIAERLVAASLVCAIDTDPPGMGITGSQRASRRGQSGRDVRLAVYVQRSDYAEAAAVHEAWIAATVPDAGLALATGMLDKCPGCDEPLAPSAAACASCGLEFPEMQAACPACGQAVTPEAESCASCGHRP
jgi:hypothetical protein